MSINYYLRNTIKHKDCEKLTSYWDSSFKEDVYALIYNYAKRNNVSEEMSDELIDEIKDRLTYFPISNDVYEQKIGYVSGGRFYFSYDYYADIVIHDTKELEAFLKNHTEFGIVDEYGHPCELKELLEMK